jgi:hypothetical protein
LRGELRDAIIGMKPTREFQNLREILHITSGPLEDGDTHNVFMQGAPSISSEAMPNKN